jgi:hypothetical protein
MTLTAAGGSVAIGVSLAGGVKADDPEKGVLWPSSSGVRYENDILNNSCYSLKMFLKLLN